MGIRATSALRRSFWIAVALVTTAGGGREQVKFGPNDIPTVFFISKSDGEGQVDYGLRLDEACVPVGDEAVVPYWREYENFIYLGGTHALGWLDRRAYGVAGQRIAKRSAEGTEIVIRLKPMSRELTISVSKGSDGRCRAVARTTIGTVAAAEFASAYIKLKSSLSVEYVELRGKHPDTGEPITERMTP